MATPPSVVRAGLVDITTAVGADLAEVAAQSPADRQVENTINALPLIVPDYYDAAGSLSVAWYDELREESRPATAYAPKIIGNPSTDWIDREVSAFRKALDEPGELIVGRLLVEAVRLAQKEVTRGFQDTVLGNARQDPDAIGWSRVARSNACKLCTMIAARGAVFRKETAHFATHKSCHCTAQPAFRNGERGPEASVEQYMASTKRRTEEQQAQLREYLNENYPDARG